MEIYFGRLSLRVNSDCEVEYAVKSKGMKTKIIHQKTQSKFRLVFSVTALCNLFKTLWELCKPLNPKL